MSWNRVHLTTVGEIPAAHRGVAQPAGGGETKTRKPRRTLTLPPQAVDVLRTHKAKQATDRLAAAELWHDTGLAFCTAVGGTGLARRTSGAGSVGGEGIRDRRQLDTAGAATHLRCSPLKACRSRRSHPSWATPERRSPRPSTARSCDQR